jgi:hypothetical protein
MGTTKVAKKVNVWFVKYASEHIQAIDMDERGLYAEVISERTEGQSYRVHVDESAVVPNAVSCSCKANSDFDYHCKHAQAVDLYYQRVYKDNTTSNTQQYQAKQAAKASPTSYVMSEVLLSKLASISEEETKLSEEKAARVAKIHAEVDAVAAETAKNDTAEHLEAVYEELREMKTLKVGQRGSTALAMNRRDTSVLNSAQQQASKLMELPSRQRKQQQDAMAS